MSSEELLKEEALKTISKIREEGRTDNEICLELIKLTRLLGNNFAENGENKNRKISLHKLIENDCLHRILILLDRRNSKEIQIHSALTLSAYLKSAGNPGCENVSNYISIRLKHKESNDCIIAFSILANLFPLVPELAQKFILSDGFILNLEKLVKKELKCKEAELAALEMLNAACMNTECRGTISMLCKEWLMENVQRRPEYDFNGAVTKASQPTATNILLQSDNFNIISDLSAVILAKLQVGKYGFKY